MINLAYAQEQLEVKGFVQYPSLFSNSEINGILEKTEKGIADCIKQIGCSSEAYLQSVSRWLAPSPPLENTADLATERIQPFISQLLDEQVTLAKINLISKSAYAPAPIAYHQDIAYSPQSPYRVSVWMPLHYVSGESGSLTLFEKSHRAGIMPPIDFWSPFYDASAVNQHLSKFKKVEIEASPGDLVIFDSALWHGSGSNKRGDDRFAIVSRWTTPTFKPYESIPEKQPLPFGMWLCGETTQKLLQKGLARLKNITLNDAIDLIDAWKTLVRETALPFDCNQQETLAALESLSILERASRLHNGGDGQGLVYQGVWHAFLKNLQEWLTLSEP